MKKLLPQSVKNIYHLIQAILANFWFGFPSRKIKIIGITGTNGKTTTAQMVAKILEEAGHRTAMISTINFKLGEKEWVNKTKFTTLSSWATQKFIKKAINAKCNYLVLETSSHSLDQHRVWGVKYNTAVITNVTREHLDYHKTMGKYRRAKLKLFKNVETAVVNLEMEKPSDFLSFNNDKKCAYSIKYNVSSIKYKKIKEKVGDIELVAAKNVKLGINKSSYIIPASPARFAESRRAGGHNTKYIIHLLGRFNIENALAAVCVGLAEGINLEISARALEKIKGIPGRMESVPNDKGLNIIIDYAVTPDSLEKLYEQINEIKKTLPLEKHARRLGGGDVRRTEGFEKNSKSFKSSSNSSFSKGGEPKIISVSGSCGERDRGKRPIMGKIVSRFADYIIITNEDPYNEDPQRIVDEVFSGVSKHPHPPTPSPSGRGWLAKPGEGKIENKNCWRILDRREAIKKALRIAKPGDFIVITGKGAEETMAIGKKRIPWNDKKVILELLAN